MSQLLQFVRTVKSTEADDRIAPDADRVRLCRRQFFLPGRHFACPTTFFFGWSGCLILHFCIVSMLLFCDSLEFTPWVVFLFFSFKHTQEGTIAKRQYPESARSPGQSRNSYRTLPSPNACHPMGDTSPPHIFMHPMGETSKVLVRPHSPHFLFASTNDSRSLAHTKCPNTVTTWPLPKVRHAQVKNLPLSQRP